MIGYKDKRELIPEDRYLFSVTQMQEYYNNSSDFFRKVILKEDIPFQNTNTVLGTLLHYAISESYEDRKVPDNEIREYIDSVTLKFPIDKKFIIDKYYQMVDIATKYANNIDFDKPTEQEQDYLLQLSDNVYVGGTLDVRYGNTIYDFKTTSNKSLQESDPLPQKYIDQLYTYAYILHQQSIKVDKCGIIYFTVPEVGRFSDKTGKRLKDYPMRCIKKEFYLDANYMKTIVDRLELIRDNIEYIIKNPESLYLFAKDTNLMEPY